MGKSIYDRDGNVRTDMSDREMAHKTWKWVIVIVLLSVVLPLSIWGIKAALAPQIGRVNQQTVINNPLNQIAQYEHFFNLDASIKTRRTEIKDDAAQLSAFDKMTPPGTADPTGLIAQARSQLSTLATNAAKFCSATAGMYNDDVLMYSERNFLDKKLPFYEDPVACEAPA